MYTSRVFFLGGGGGGGVGDLKEKEKGRCVQIPSGERAELLMRENRVPCLGYSVQLMIKQLFLGLLFRAATFENL